jgi:hypothetical protein
MGVFDATRRPASSPVTKAVKQASIFFGASSASS